MLEYKTPIAKKNTRDVFFNTMYFSRKYLTQYFFFFFKYQNIILSRDENSFQDFGKILLDKIISFSIQLLMQKKNCFSIQMSKL